MSKRVYAALVLTFLLGMLVAGCQQETTQTSAIPSETYSNAEYGFSVNYPDGWKVAEDDYPSGLGATINFSKEGAAQVSIMVWTAPESPALGPQFYSLEDFYERGVIAAWEDHEGFEILNERNTAVDKLPAKEVTFTYKTTEFDFKHTIVAFLDTRQKSPPNSNAFKILYDMPIDMPENIKALYKSSITYDAYYRDFRLIVDTFKFMEGPKK